MDCLSDIHSTPGSGRIPCAAAFGEWNTANLGDRAIFFGVKRFFEAAGWGILPIAFGSLVPVQEPGVRNPIPRTTPNLHRFIRRWKPLLRPLRQRLRAHQLTKAI